MTEQTGTDIAQFQPFEANMLEFRTRYDGVVYDLTNPAQDKQARSDRHQIGKVIARLDGAHKDLKAPLLEKVQLIDGERKRIKDALLGVQGKIKAQIDTHEAKLRAHADMLQGKVDAIIALGVFDGVVPTSAQVAERLKQAQVIEIDTKYESRQADAALAQMQTGKALENLFEQQAKIEAEQAELARLRAEQQERERKEREEKIRAEAAEKAKRKAEEKARHALEEARRQEQNARRREQEAKNAKEQSERRAKEAAEKAGQERKEAEERAARQERARIEKNRRQADEKAQAQRKTEEAKKARKNHKDKIHRGAIKSLIAVGIEKDMAVTVVRSIATGAIAHIVIEY